MNVRSFLEEKAARLPDKTCLVFERERFSFREFDALVNRVANSLADLGVGPGDRVGGVMPNCLEWIVLYFAVAKLGAANVFVNTQYDANLLLGTGPEPTGLIDKQDEASLRDVGRRLRAGG